MVLPFGKYESYRNVGAFESCSDLWGHICGTYRRWRHASCYLFVEFIYWFGSSGSRVYLWQPVDDCRRYFGWCSRNDPYRTDVRRDESLPVECNNRWLRRWWRFCIGDLP